MNYSGKCIVCGNFVDCNRGKYCSQKCRYANREKAIIIGEKINRLTIIKEVERVTVKTKKGTIQNKRMALCSCDCGNKIVVNLGKFWMGKAKSCGCISKEHLRRMAIDRTIKLPFYHNLKSVWHKMIYRCYNPKSNNYSIYGKMGVMVCKEWRNDFMPFYNWAMANGWKPGLEIDKDILGGKLYGPNTCIVVTTKVNGYNKSTNIFVSFQGEKISIAELADRFNKPYETVRHRISNKGMTAEEAITKPIKSYKRHL